MTRTAPNSSASSVTKSSAAASRVTVRALSWNERCTREITDTTMMPRMKSAAIRTPSGRSMTLTTVV